MFQQNVIKVLLISHYFTVFHEENFNFSKKRIIVKVSHSNSKNNS